MFIDRYITPGMQVACDLVNELVVVPNGAPHVALQTTFAIDPSSAADLRPRDTEPFIALAHELYRVFDAIEAGDLDTAAEAINTLLLRAPAHPHLAKEAGVWRLHHHPLNTDLIGSWTAICAEALARLVGDGHAQRAHMCEAADCRRVYIDATKNATRRFCSTTCQNRVKTAARRRRQATL